VSLVPGTRGPRSMIHLPGAGVSSASPQRFLRRGLELGFRSCRRPCRDRHARARHLREWKAKRLPTHAEGVPEPAERTSEQHGAAPESNRPSRGLHDRTGFEDASRPARIVPSPYG
jgi:hypothetical protein